MKGISDIQIIGIDELRPPLILKEPYIDLHFKLNHQAPPQWCDEYNRLVANMTYTTRIDSKVGLFIDTWVRKIEEIEPAFQELKGAVKACSEAFVARAEAERQAAMEAGQTLTEDGEQARLNRVIDGLDFSA